MRGKSAALGVAAAAAFSGAIINGASAATCASGVSLSTYTAAGFSCTVGDKLFSAFGYVTAGGVTLAASGVTVTTESDAQGVGFLFTGAWNDGTAANGDINISFSVATTSGQPLIHDAYIHFGGGSGTIRDIETLSGTKTFTATLQTTQSSATSDIILGTNQSSLKATDDVSLLTAGAALSAIEKEFSQVATPEPSSMALLGVGLSALGLVGVRRRKRR